MLNNPFIIEVVMKEQHQDRLKEVERWRLYRAVRQGQARGTRPAGLRLWLLVRGWSATVWLSSRRVMNHKNPVKRKVLS